MVFWAGSGFARFLPIIGRFPALRPRSGAWSFMVFLGIPRSAGFLPTFRQVSWLGPTGPEALFHGLFGYSGGGCGGRDLARDFDPSNSSFSASQKVSENLAEFGGFGDC